MSVDCSAARSPGRGCPNMAHFRLFGGPSGGRKRPNLGHGDHFSRKIALTAPAGLAEDVPLLLGRLVPYISFSKGSPRILSARRLSFALEKPPRRIRHHAAS